MFQAVEAVGTDKGVTVAYVLLPAPGLPFSVLLGAILSVELYERDCFGVFLMPAAKFFNVLFDAEVVNLLTYKRVEVKSVQVSYIFYVCKWLTYCDLIHYKPHLPKRQQ